MQSAQLTERIQKLLADAGLGSRREIEAWIAEGRVAVNGRRAKLGDRIDGTERIVVNGRPVGLKRRAGTHGHIAYHKPAGEVTTRDDPEHRATVFDRLPAAPRGRWINVGRLDLNTSGLLILTTDGELAHRLMHPRYEITREYAVRLLGESSDAQLRALLDGIELEDGPARLDSIDVRGGAGRNTWLHVTLKEGRNREVRRMFQALGLIVSRLIRVRYGPVELGRTQRGRTRPLTGAEIAALYDVVSLAPPERPPRTAGRRPGSPPRPDERKPGAKERQPRSAGERRPTSRRPGTRQGSASSERSGSARGRRPPRSRR